MRLDVTEEEARLMIESIIFASSGDVSWNLTEQGSMELSDLACRLYKKYKLKPGSKMYMYSDVIQDMPEIAKKYKKIVKQRKLKKK